ncbi:DUF1003 domain-containing protein [Sphingomonas radiodurans]|uniref:DUF1003 domain-containing protein n=1 Tax=Sphingomonas radiodurans TaxID=2890321 RepID=UPI001E2FAE2C|nr:DUF1003 domain-containing protein [Sphingomonas radiodurans]WBH17477.1 DUF1003 domain-containing protein [Sphingomonas radiodurans]
MTKSTLTHPAPTPPGLTSVLDRNITRMQERRAADERDATLSERVSDAITRFAGSMTFVIIHAVAYGTWIAINVGIVPGIEPFDPSFVMLAMEASVEAIFLSTFVLISQNRMMGAAARQSDLDLQINLLAEHELTHLVSIVDAMARKMGVDIVDEAHLSEIKQDVSPEAVLDGLDAADRK